MANYWTNLQRYNESHTTKGVLQEGLENERYKSD